MGNPITPQISTGTLGELLVQIKLLSLGVQAAPPIKDSGNDLIAIKGEIVKFVQVKTATNRKPNKRNLPDTYHLLALVKLVKKKNNNQIELDKSEILIVKKGELKEKTLNQKLVDEIWR